MTARRGAHAWLACVALLAGLAAARPARAGISEQVPIGPRAIALGGAYGALTDDPTALFWNPSGLVRVDHQEVLLSHADLFRTGIRDNYAAFALPLTPTQAVGMDWYHSGFDDGELGFGENRLGLAYAIKLRPWLSAGVTGRLLTRQTTLDGTDAGQGRGFGADFGLQAQATDRLRVGLAAQDVSGTRVDDGRGGASLVYPRNLRLSAAYTHPRWGAVALDLDDRWHLGIEATPHDLVALRLGAQEDWKGGEGVIWSCGAGAKVGWVRADYARVGHPTLDATDHFSVALEFNLNPPLVRIEAIEARAIYASLYRSYAHDPVGVVRIRNLQPRAVEVRVGLRAPDLMGGPTETTVHLRPLATTELALTAVLDEKVLARRSDERVRLEVTASYRSRQLQRVEKASASAMAYGRGAISWDGGVAPAAAFVTTQDPAVAALAREASRTVALLSEDPLGNRNLSFAAALIDALAQMGVAYVPDPNNPFAEIAETRHAVDTVHYPFETLARRAGDCDDTTVLLASLLGNVGISSRLVDAPGHVFLLVDTGLHERQRLGLGVDEGLSVVIDERLWVPLETTALLQGFAEAWRIGADQYRTWAARGELESVEVSVAQNRYAPGLPPGERPAPVLDASRLQASLERDKRQVATWKEAHRTARYGTLSPDLATSTGALIEIAYVTLLAGQVVEAGTHLARALENDPTSWAALNDLAVVKVAEDSLARAEELLQAALAMGAKDPGVALNLGLCRYARGDTIDALAIMAPAVEALGGHEKAGVLLGLATGDSDRGTVPGPGALLAQRALREAASAGTRGRGAAARHPDEAATRLVSGVDLHRHLYWKD